MADKAAAQGQARIADRDTFDPGDAVLAIDAVSSLEQRHRQRSRDEKSIEE
jgi:hypothetical protein